LVGRGVRIGNYLRDDPRFEARQRIAQKEVDRPTLEPATLAARETLLAIARGWPNDRAGQMGVPVVQGYFISMPLAPDRVVSMIKGPMTDAIVRDAKTDT
jgi:hypothetical protein